MPIRYFDPTAEPSQAAEPYKLSVDIEVEPVTVCVVANTFSGATKFSDHIKAALLEIVPSLTVLRYDKADTSPAPGDLRRTISRRCDAVVSIYGHCGSCTSGTIRDGINFAREGIPSIGLVTEKFADEAEFIARAGGMPDVPWLRLPHPIAGTGDEHMISVARDVAPLIIATLRGEI
jgi:hypothetical protein